MSWLAKPANHCLNLGHVDALREFEGKQRPPDKLAAKGSYHAGIDPAGGFKIVDGVLGLLKDQREPPIACQQFACQVAAKAFTNGADMDRVIGQQQRVATTVLGSAERLNFDNLGWGASAAPQLVQALKETSGLLSLNVGGNVLGPSGAAILCEALMELALLQVLNLDGNGIGDAGVQHLCKVVQQGGLDQLKTIQLGNNQISDDGIHCLCEAALSGGFSRIQELQLHQNQIGCGGLKCISTSLTHGSFVELHCLHLEMNRICDDGLKAFADAIGAGWFERLSHLFIFMNAYANISPLVDVMRQGRLMHLEELYIDVNHVVPGLTVHQTMPICALVKVDAELRNRAP